MYPNKFSKFRKAFPFSQSWVSGEEIRNWIGRCAEDILKGKCEDGDKLGKSTRICSGDSQVIIIDWGEDEYEIIVMKGYMKKTINKEELKRTIKSS